MADVCPGEWRVTGSALAQTYGRSRGTGVKGWLRMPLILFHPPTVSGPGDQFTQRIDVLALDTTTDHV